MFKARHIETDTVWTVYAVSGTLFLIWEARWIWAEMEEFEPIEEE